MSPLTPTAPGWIGAQEPRRAAIGPAGIARQERRGRRHHPARTFSGAGDFLSRRPYRQARCTSLPLRAITADDGWCDAPDDPNYNRLVKLPYPASAEHMWREDHLYDLVAVLGYNDDPVVPGKGSAIFLHVARRIIRRRRAVWRWPMPICWRRSSSCGLAIRSSSIEAPARRRSPFRPAHAWRRISPPARNRRSCPC